MALSVFLLSWRCSAVACGLLFFLISSTGAQSPGEDFVVAFHITVNAASVSLLPRLMKAIHHPANVYLVDAHVGTNASAARELGANVVVRTVEPPTPHGVSSALATLSAMAFFLDWADTSARNFHYFINVSPDEHPILNPSDVRALLHDLPKANFLYAQPEDQWARSAVDYDHLWYDPAIVFTRNAKAAHALMASTFGHPDRALRARKIAMGSARMVVSFDFVLFATESMTAKRALVQFAEARHAAEHFFPTIAVDARNVHGTWVRTTSLRCPSLVREMLALHVDGAGAVERHGDDALAIAEPCLFTGPMRHGDIESAWVRDELDKQQSVGSGNDAFVTGVRTLAANAVQAGILAASVDAMHTARIPLLL